MNNPLKYIDPSGYRIYAVPEIGDGVYYDDVEDRYIFYSSIIGREAELFGHGFSAITTMPGYRSSGNIYKVDAHGNVEYGYYAKVSFSTSGEGNPDSRCDLGVVNVTATRPEWISIGTSRLSSDVNQSMFQHPLGRINITIEEGFTSRPKKKKEKKDWPTTIEERLDIYDRQIQLNYYNDMQSPTENGLGPTLYAIFQAIFNINTYDTLLIDSYLDEIRHYRDSLKYVDYWD